MISHQIDRRVQTRTRQSNKEINEEEEEEEGAVDRYSSHSSIRAVYNVNVEAARTGPFSFEYVCTYYSLVHVLLAGTQLGANGRSKSHLRRLPTATAARTSRSRGRYPLVSRCQNYSSGHPWDFSIVFYIILLIVLLWRSGCSSRFLRTMSLNEGCLNRNIPIIDDYRLGVCMYIRTMYIHKSHKYLHERE